MKLKASSVSEIPVDYIVYGYPISQSWNMGTGRYATGGNLVGASWNYKDYAGDSGTLWYITSSIPSPNTSSFVNEGGTWYTQVPNSYVQKTSSFCTNLTTGSSLICSQSFEPIKLLHPIKSIIISIQQFYDDIKKKISYNDCVNTKISYNSAV